MGSENIPVRLPRSPVGGETLSESRGKRLISFFIFCTNQTALSQIPNTWSLWVPISDIGLVRWGKWTLPSLTSYWFWFDAVCKKSPNQSKIVSPPFPFSLLRIHLRSRPKWWECIRQVERWILFIRKALARLPLSKPNKTHSFPVKMSTFPVSRFGKSNRSGWVTRSGVWYWSRNRLHSSIKFKSLIIFSPVDVFIFCSPLAFERTENLHTPGFPISIPTFDPSKVACQDKKLSKEIKLRQLRLESTFEMSRRKPTLGKDFAQRQIHFGDISFRFCAESSKLQNCSPLKFALTISTRIASLLCQSLG